VGEVTNATNHHLFTPKQPSLFMPFSTTTKRKRPQLMLQQPSPPHHRIILLFDLDAFYAQTERVRLGLGLDASLALLQ
jgi:hypothetical protein